MKRHLLVLAAAVVAGCGASDRGRPDADVGTHPAPDAPGHAAGDAAVLDAAASDAAPGADGGGGDAARADAAATDARPPADAHPPADARPPDAAPPPDGGVTGTWTSLDSGTTDRLYAVWGTASGGDIWAVGLGVVLHSTDHGASWTPEYDDGGVTYFTSVWGSGPDDVYVLAKTKLLHWNGQALSPQTITLHGEPTSVRGRGAGEVFVFDGLSTIYVSRSTGGGTWALRGSCDAEQSIVGQHAGGWGSGTKILYLLDYDVVCRSGDDGVTWTKQFIDGGFGGGFFGGIWGTSPNDLYIASDNGSIARTDDDGLTWTVQTTPTDNPLNALWGTGDDVWAVGSGITILHTTDHGAHWVAEKQGVSSNQLYGVWGTGPGDVYAVGDNGIIVHRH
jgi:photosystem II stability/assembly factor-like uncharacterized protein